LPLGKNLVEDARPERLIGATAKWWYCAINQEREYTFAIHSQWLQRAVQQPVSASKIGVAPAREMSGGFLAPFQWRADTNSPARK
jgi:hypothetical protein